MSRTNPGRPAGLLARVVDAAYTHRRRVLLGWILTLVLAIVAATALGGEYATDYSTPGSGSKAAADRIERGFAGRSSDQVSIVWKAADGAMTSAVRPRIDQLLRQLDGIDGIVPGSSTTTAERSRDGTTAVVRVALDRPASSLATADGERIRSLVEHASTSNLEVAAGGRVPGLTEAPGMSSEVVGLAVAAIVLLLTLGSMTAAGLPLLVALFGVGVGVTLGTVLAAVLDTPDWAMQVSLMIGIGVGIDYALLILTRYRSALDEGLEPRAANLEAMTTAGRSVLTAGATVVVSLLGLFLMRLPYLYGVALASSLTVLLVLAASVTLLPAAIGFAGRRLTRRWVPTIARRDRDPQRLPAARWARAVTRRPLVAIVVALIALAVLASPVTGIRFGFPDAGNDATTSTTRKAYDLLADGFGPGANGPLIAVAALDAPADAGRLGPLAAEIGRDRDVAAVAAPVRNPAGDVAMLAIVPKGSPQAASTKQLVERLRDGPLAHAGISVELGGQTAASLDESTVTAERLPLFIGAVVLLSFLLLLGAFRAPIVALKASVMTVLSIVAAYGVVALVADGGWAGQLIGIDADLPVPAFIPVMMFAVLFGLSMDYVVFLVSRIGEERERLGDARASVVSGLAHTSKVIVAAAAIMVSVFGAFALSPDPMLKLIGVGLAAAILIDVLIVRLVLVPATMRLLGERAWWAPAGLGRRPEDQRSVETAS
jgi:RND superfamily putative drug exporter